MLLTFAGLLFAYSSGTLIDEIAAADRKADAAVASIATAEELAAKRAEWRAAWIEGLGGLPERTPLNAQVGPVVKYDGFTLHNVLFESQPGVYVVGHLFLPDAEKFKPPYPCVLMPMGHSDNGIFNRRYATHAAMTARAGLAVFSWDPLSQGERRQVAKRFDGCFAECSWEHSSLGARGWLVGWNFARFRLWDAFRAVDYVTTRPEIDAKLLGVMGTSGGGTMSAYLQALDERITVGFPNCYVSSMRAVFGDRGCHDAEQYFFGQLAKGVNHAAILALGQPRVKLATGSRWKDYFPHAGAVDTFSVFTNMTTRLGLPGPYWHFSCDGPHGLPASTRAAQLDWMLAGLCGTGVSGIRSLEEYRAIDPGPLPKDDFCNSQPLPFKTNDTFFTKTHFVRDLKGFKSVYALIAERAVELRAKRTVKTREELREIVRRRANIRPLSQLLTFNLQPLTFETDFGWWYLKGPYGAKIENRAAILSTLGKSYVGEQAEAMLRKSAAAVEANGGQPIVLKAKGYDCIAAAHAYAAEPQLFSGVDFSERPPSWTAMVVDPNPTNDSFAVGVWGALKEYDWTDLVPAGQVPSEPADVVVVGGGPAGIGAALAAAGCGARTVLVERDARIGGTTVSAEVLPMGHFYAWKQQIVDGPGWALVTNAVALADGSLPDFSRQDDRRWWEFCVRVNPFVYSALAAETLEKAGVELRFNTAACGMEKMPDGWRIRLATDAGEKTLLAKEVIDATGNGAVAAFAGAQRVRSDDADRQPGSYFFRLNTKGMAFDAAAVDRAHAAAVADGTLLKSDVHVKMSSYVRNGGGWGCYVPLADNSTAEARAETNRRGRETMLRILRFVRKQPGLGRATVVSAAPEVGVRETYRVVGEKTVNEEDYLDGTVENDSLCYSYWMIDAHKSSQNVARLRFHETGKVGTIPLGAMLPKGTGNLLVAGRAVSSDHGANSALRVQASCMAMGQAAGVVAALAAKRGVDPRAVDLKEAKDALRRLGCIVPQAD